MRLLSPRPLQPCGDCCLWSLCPRSHCPLLPIMCQAGPSHSPLGHTHPTGSEVPLCQDNKPGLLSSSLQPFRQTPPDSQEGPFCVAGQEQTWTSLWVANPQIPCRLPLMMPSRVLWGSWAQSLSVPIISLIIGSSFHSASMTFLGSYGQISSSYKLRKGGYVRPARNT